MRGFPFWERVLGFKLGFHFIPYPQEIVDDTLDLSLGEYRLLGYLLRHTLRLGEPIIRLKQDDLLNGRLLPTGSRVDKGCNLSSGRDIKTARDRLVERGWLKVEDSKEGMLYRLLIVDFNGDASKVQNALGKSADCLFEKCNLHSAYKEVEGQKKVSRKPLAAKAAGGDSRKELKDRIESFLKKLIVARTGLPTPDWNGRDRAVLNREVDSHPKWTDDDWARMLKNLEHSDPELVSNFGKKPFWYISHISEFSAGPKKRLNGNGRPQRVDPAPTASSKLEEMMRQMRPNSTEGATP